MVAEASQCARGAASPKTHDARTSAPGEATGMPPPTSCVPVPRWSWAARFARRQRVKGSLWFVPLLCAIAGPLLAEGAIALDAVLDPRALWSYTDSTASTVLSAIVGAMVGLTGFVVAFGVLVMQMATQALS